MVRIYADKSIKYTSQVDGISLELISLRFFNAHWYMALFEDLRMAPSLVDSDAQTVEHGKEPRALLISTNFLSLCEIASKAPRTSLCTVTSVLSALFTFIFNFSSRNVLGLVLEIVSKNDFEPFMSSHKENGMCEATPVSMTFNKLSDTTHDTGRPDNKL